MSLNDGSPASARRTTGRRRRLVTVTGGLALAGLALSACTGTTAQHTSTSLVPPTTPSSSSPPPTTSAPALPLAALSFSEKANAANVNPKAPITVTATKGTLSEVLMKNDAGKAIAGRLSADKTSWTAAEVLGYGKKYTVSARAVNRDGKPTAQTEAFSTVTPDNMTQPYIDTAGGNTLTDGATYGVGMVVNVVFDESIPNRKAAEQALKVTTVPAQVGGWYWVDNTHVHWRSAKYLTTGTKVTVAADLYGVNVGNGLYGESDVEKSFVIGAKHVSIADDNTKQVKVYFNDKLQRSMPTSMGRGGPSVIGTGGQVISFFTQRGTYTVLDQANPVLMDSSTYGLAVNSKIGYKENIYWATRISTDGVYLHELDTTVWAQGNTDTSHGCLNLNHDNAEWFYQHAQVGDIVQVVHTGGQPLQVWQGGDWSLSWAQWKAGSAL